MPVPATPMTEHPAPFLIGGDLDMAAFSEAVRLLKFASFFGNNGVMPDDVWMEVLAYLDVGELAKLRHVSKSLRRMVSIHLKSRLFALLRDYLHVDSRVLAFHRLMDETESVIGGAEALRFVRPGPWETDNLDIFTPYERAQPFIDLLESWGGFIVPREGVPSPSVYTYLDKRRDTLSVTTIKLDNKFIHVLESRTGSAMHAVLDGWTTALMNVITSRFVIVPFPHMTFEDIGLYSVGNILGFRDVASTVVSKYETRGYQHFDTTIYGDFGTVCLSNWWSVDKTDRVCSLPLDYTETDTPPEFANNLRWRIGSVCRVLGCPHKRDEEEEERDELEWLDLLRE